MFDVVIPRHEISRFPDNGGFEDEIVIGIATDRQRSGEGNQRGAGGNELTVPRNVGFGNAVFSLDTRSSKDIVYFGQ